MDSFISRNHIPSQKGSPRRVVWPLEMQRKGGFWLDAAGAEVQRIWLIVLLWIVLSLSLSYYNSWLLRGTQPGELHRIRQPGFAFPFFYTLHQTVFQSVVLQIMFCFVDEATVRPSWVAFKKHWPLLIVLTAGRVMQEGVENLALTYFGSPAMMQGSFMLCVPLFTMLLACVIEGRRFRWELVLSVVGITGACTLVTLGCAMILMEPIVTALGVVAALGNAVTPVIAALLLRSPDNSVLVLGWWQAVLKLPVYLTAWLLSNERWSSLQYLVNYPMIECFCLVGSCIALCFCLVTFNVIRETSSLTNVVLGSTTHIVMVVLAAYVVEQLSNVLINLGVALYVPALLAYALLMLANCGTYVGSSTEGLPLKGPPNETTALSSNGRVQAGVYQPTQRADGTFDWLVVPSRATVVRRAPILSWLLGYESTN
jgi:drug/metabolite transporter (DMT)-like permease